MLNIFPLPQPLLRDTLEVSQLLQSESRLDHHGSPFLPSGQTWKAVTRGGGGEPTPAPPFLPLTSTCCWSAPKEWVAYLCGRHHCDYRSKGFLVSAALIIWSLFPPRRSPRAALAAPPCPDQASGEAPWCWGGCVPGKPTCVTSMAQAMGCMLGCLICLHLYPTYALSRIFCHRNLQVLKLSKCDLLERFSVITFWALRHGHIMFESCS